MKFASFVLATVILSSAANADTVFHVSNEDLFKLHDKGEAGISEFIKTNGFRSKDKNPQQQQQQGQYQQQQQQQAQQQPYSYYYYDYADESQYCGIKTNYVGTWRYSEIMSLATIAANKKVVSARSSVEGFSTAPYAAKVDKALSQNLNDGRVRCHLVVYTQELVQPVIGKMIRKKVTDNSCLKSCLDNGLDNCDVECSEITVGPAEACKNEAPAPTLSQVSCSLETL